MRQLILIILFISKAYAYPVFFKCEDKQITFKENFNDNDLFDKVMKMDRLKRDQQLNSWCDGAYECLKDFELILKLSGSNYEIAKNLFEEKLEKLNTNGSIQLANDLNVAQLSKLKRGYNTIRACQAAKADLDSSEFLTYGDKNIVTTYPYYSNYMYVTGCAGVDSPMCTPIVKNDLDRVIKESVTMGVDPYLVLSLSLMEGGTSNIGSLYLDPIGVMAALGCSSKQVANNTSKDKALDSYGTSYIVNSDVKKIPALQKKLSKYFDTFEKEKSEGNSFYCYETKGRSAPEVFSKPQENSCCLDLGFKTTKRNSETLKHALTYHFIDKITKNPFRKRADPAWRAQRYNGYTNLMGAAEGVSPWRAGVDYYKNPAYGHQTMDYIINSLMFNPYISKEVDRHSSEIGTKWDSILCKGKKDGTYHIDSDYYFNKHKNSKRMEGIEQKFKKGYSYDQLSRREKKVLNADMMETAQKNSKMPNVLPQRVESKLQEKILSELNKGVEGNFIVFNEYKNATKEQWLDKVSSTTSFTAEELEKIYNHQMKGNKLSIDQNHIHTQMNDIQNSLSQECQKIQNQEKLSECVDQVNDMSNHIYQDNITDIDEDSEFEAISSGSKKLNELLKKKKKVSKEIEDYYQNDYLSSLTNNDEDITQVYLAFSVVESVPEKMARFKASPNYSPKLEKDILKYLESIENKKVQYDKNEAYKEYFKTVFKNRDTLQKSSVFPWRKLNEKETQKLVQKIKSQKSSAPLGFDSFEQGGGF